VGDDIVTRLRDECESLKVDVQVLREAADEIERLRAEVARLNTFLHPVGVDINQVVRSD